MTEEYNTARIEIANQVNELAGRHGIRPYEFNCWVAHDQATELTSVTYRSRSSEIDEGTFFKMLDLLGLGRDKWQLEGTDSEIINTLDQAIRRSPLHRPR